MANVSEDNVPLVPHIDSEEPKKKYGFIPALAISINYIIGTGVFGLPFAFYSSGILLGLICLTVSGFFSILCINWVLEVLARAEGVVKHKEQGSPSDPPVHQITWRKFDFTTLFDTFIGWKGKAFCQFTICCYCYGVLWAYSAVFSSSISSLFFQFALDEECSIYNDPSASCNLAYHISLLIYVCIVVPMSCLDMGEQAVVQMIMTIYRFAAFGVMLVTVLVAFAYPRPEFRPGVAFHAVSAFDISGFAIVFTSGAVALNFHYNLPDIAKPVTNKLVLTRIVSAAQIVAFGFYVLLACLCASYFGNATEPLVTLNWQSYTGIAGGWGGKIADRHGFSIVVQLFIMLFPVFDMLSVFPLVAITLGNNIFESLRPYVRHRLSDKKLSIACRLIAAIPPAIAAAALGELNEIFTFAGLFAFFLELIFPCVLLLVSAQYCIKTWGPGSEKNPYTLVFSKPGFAYATLVFGGFALVFAIINFAAPSLFK